MCKSVNISVFQSYQCCPRAFKLCVYEQFLLIWCMDRIKLTTSSLNLLQLTRSGWATVLRNTNKEIAHLFNHGCVRIHDCVYWVTTSVWPLKTGVETVSGCTMHCLYECKVFCNDPPPPPPASPKVELWFSLTLVPCLNIAHVGVCRACQMVVCGELI